MYFYFRNAVSYIKASTWGRLLSATIDQEVTKEQLLLAAECVLNLERMINASFGFDHKDDTLPKRFLEESPKDERSKGQTVDSDYSGSRTDWLSSEKL